MKRILLYLFFIFLLGDNCPRLGPAFRSKPVPLGDVFRDYWQEINHFHRSINDMKVINGKIFIADWDEIYSLDSVWRKIVEINKVITSFEVSRLNPNWLLILDEYSVLYLVKNGETPESLSGRIKSYSFSPFDTFTLYFATEDSLKISYDGGASSELLLAKSEIKDFKPDPYDPGSLYLLNDSLGINYLSITNDSGQTWHSTPTPEYLDFILVDSNQVYGLSTDRMKIWQFDKTNQNWEKIGNEEFMAVDLAENGLIGVFVISDKAECWKRQGSNWKDITIGINAPGYITDSDVKLACEGNDYYLFVSTTRGGDFLYLFHDTDKEP
jgi:hypothetical protein